MGRNSASRKKKHMRVDVVPSKDSGEVFVDKLTGIFMKVAAKLTPAEREKRLKKLSERLSSLGEKNAEHA